MQRTAATTACLGAETIAEYVDGTLAAAQVHQVDAHIDHCAACRGDLSALAIAAETRQTIGPDAPPPPADPEAIEPGTLLGRFVVLETLGRGGMGVMVRAYDPDLKRAIAVKVLRPELAGLASTAAHERLRREAQAMARLSHANVVTVYDVSGGDDGVFIAMELIEGGTLRDWLVGEREWKQVLAVCRQAGRGLAAAHSAQVVHRDFKPENVLCSEDGRVLVTDFGLAHAVEEADEGGASDSASGRPTLAGTPAYMAPEVYDSDVASELSDQYSFCVTLYEALYGQRPYRGETWAQLREQQRAHNLVPPAKTSRVPEWLRRVVVRGLDPDPQKRYPSMAALLDALDADPAARRRRVAIAGAAVVGVGVIGFALFGRGSAGPPACTAPPSLLAEQWSPEINSRIAAAFAATKRGNAAETASRVAALLDDYRREWLATRKDACAATNVRKEQSAALLDLRVRCLARRQRELGQLTSTLATTRNPKLVDRAVKAVYQLRRPASCTAEAMQEMAPLPVDPDKRAAVERDQAVLARIVTQRIAGDLAGAKASASAVVKRATALGYQPLLAEARINLARVYLDLNDMAAAEKQLFAALKAAQLGRNDILVAEVWVLLVITVGAQRQRFDLAMSHAKAAEAALARVSDNRNLVARFHYAVGTTLLAKGDYKAAKARLLRALPDAIAAFGKNHGTIGSIHSALCDVNMKLGDRQAARAECKQALAIQTAAFGPHHPNVAVTLNVMGALELGAARYDKAREYFHRALAIVDRPGNERNITRALALNNIGNSWSSQGKYRKAIPVLERSEKLFARYHPDSPQRLLTTINLAGVQLQLGRAQLAIAYNRKALATATKIYGPKHERTLALTFNIALALSNLGKGDEAEKLGRKALTLSVQSLGKNNNVAAASLDLLATIAMTRKDFRKANELARRALAMQKALLGPDHPEVAYLLFRYGQTFRAMGQPTRSLAPLRQSVAIFAKHKGHNFRRALAQFSLARSLWQVQHARTRAMALVKRAKAQLVDQSIPANKKLRGLIDQWLREIRGAK